jgi:hypothetical protein
MALSQSDTAKFAMAVKNARPDITDEELSALVQEAGQVNDDPVKSQALAMKMLPQLNTNLADPYAGAGHTAADSMQQFSPEQLRAAYAKQQALYQQSQPSRAIGSIIAGGSGSGDVMNKNKADWEGIDKQNMLQSIDQQAALQTQATAGINAAKGVQDMSKVAGEYAGTQLGKQQALQGTQFTLDQTKRMNDPTSNETALAKSLILSQVGSMDNVSKAEMQKIVTKPGVTAQQLLPAMAQWAPAAQKAFMEKINAGKTVAETDSERIKNTNMISDAKAYARQQGLPDPFPDAAVGDSSPSGRASPPMNAGDNSAPTFNFKPGTNLNAIRAVMSSQPQNVQDAFNKQFPADMTVVPGETMSAQPKDVALIQRQGGTVPSSVTPQSIGKPIMNSINSDNMDPAYVANAKMEDLSPVQQLMRKRLESTDNSEVVDLDRQIAAATGKPVTAPGAGLQMVKTPTGSGTYSTQVSPVSTAAMDATGKRIQAKADSIDTFNATGRQSAQNTIKLANSAGWDNVKNTFTGTDEDAKRLQLSVDRLNAEAQRLGLVVGGTNTGAAAAGGAVSGMLGRFSPLLGAASGAFSQLLAQTEPLSNKTPPEVLKQFGYMTQLVAERQKALLSKENAWAVSHNGDTSGFLQSPEYKFIMNAEPYVNPATGDLVLPITRNQQDRYLRDDYGPLSSVSFNSPRPGLVQPDAKRR